LDQTWKYSTKFNPSAPVISVELAGMTLECVVDTGFSGGLMIPLRMFESLGLLTGLVPEEYLAVMPDSRRLALYTAREEVTAGSLRVRTLVHAAATLDRKLVGRAFLESFVATLDGPREVLSISRQSTQ
jgi:predicted aspartyl protease